MLKSIRKKCRKTESFKHCCEPIETETYEIFYTDLVEATTRQAIRNLIRFSVRAMKKNMYFNQYWRSPN